ncbi:MAG: hypothetical protein ACRDWA_02330 [Acidimicrobiia bacterium]
MIWAGLDLAERRLLTGGVLVVWLPGLVGFLVAVMFVVRRWRVGHDELGVG